MFAGRYRWLVILFLFIAGVLNYVDRAALATIAPLLMHDLGLSPGLLGILFSSFAVGYAACCFIGGWAADRVGPWRILAFAVGFWSIFSGLTSVVGGFGSLLVVRMLFGVGEGPYAPATNKLVGQWFPRNEQATAVGFAISGVTLGGAIAGPLIGLIATQSGGWRLPFAVIGGLGLVWTVAWLVIARDHPAQHPRVSGAERALISSGPQDVTDTPLATGIPLRQYLLRPTILAVGFAFFCYSYVVYFFMSWFPTYLSMTYEFSLQKISFLGAVPWLLGFVGFACSGLLCDAVYRRTGNLMLSRKLILVTGLTMAAACVALAGASTGVASAVALMAVAIFFTYLTTSAYWTLVLDTVEPGQVGSVSGFVLLLSNCGGIVAPLVTGYLVQWTGKFDSAFFLAGACSVLGALTVMLVVKSAATPVAGSTRVLPPAEQAEVRPG